MENQFYAEFLSDALYLIIVNDCDFGFYDVTVLNKTNTN